MPITFIEFLVIISLAITFFANNARIINLVGHKNSQLNLYLDLIQYNTHEKLEILPYILKNPEGHFLEVGTGGDPIAELLSNIPTTLSPTIIASDIDQNILDSLPFRHPQLNKFLNNKDNGPILRLQQLDATSMNCFSDNSLDGINASAVVHEIVSYAGGLKGLDKFFSEAIRVLKPNGVLIYRDPEAVENKYEMVNIILKTATIRYFVHIFLFKFLDQTHGKLASEGRKSEKYSPESITITFYKQNTSLPCTTTFEQYLNTRTCEIDCSRGFSLTLPRGLCREIERHYLTYLHQCNPLVFIKCLPSIDSETFLVNYLAPSTPVIFDEFLKKNNLHMHERLIDIETKLNLNSTILNNTNPIEYGIPLFLSPKNKNMLCNVLKLHDFDPNNYIVPIKNDYYLLDYRIFGLLYDHIKETVFDANNGPVNKEDIIHAEWLKREGEETYIYYSEDSLLTAVAEISLSQYPSDDEPFILCPLGVEQNKFIPRRCYEEILKESLDIIDEAGFPIEIKEGKRIIHFGKLTIQEALSIYKDIIAKDPDKYVKLRYFVEHILSKKISHIEDL